MITLPDRALTHDEKTVLRALANSTPVFATLRELADASGLPTGQVLGALDQLGQLGLAHRWQDRTIGRSYVLTAKAAGQLKVRLDWSAGANASRWVAQSKPRSKRQPATSQPAAMV